MFEMYDLNSPVSFSGGGGGEGGGGDDHGVCTPSDPDGDGISWGGAAGDFGPSGQGYNEGLSMPDGSPIGGNNGGVSFNF